VNTKKWRIAKFRENDTEYIAEYASQIALRILDLTLFRFDDCALCILFTLRLRHIDCISGELQK